MKYLILVLIVFFTYSVSFSQKDNHSEIGIEIQAASFSNHGGTVGGALKYAFVTNESFAFGPSIRMQYIWSQNQYLGFKGKTFAWGGGAFAHFRFLQWFFLGAEVEYLKNPYAYYNPLDKSKWALTAFVGGGVSKEWGRVRLNVGILYDLVDGLSDPHKTNPSPLSRDYFLKISNPQNPNYGKYLPMIYRIALFINLGSDKNKAVDEYDFD